MRQNIVKTNINKLNIMDQVHFLQTLYHDARGGAIVRTALSNHIPVTGTLVAGVDPNTVIYKKDDYDCYVTINAMRNFNNNYISRKSEHVYALQAFYLDLDTIGHNIPKNLDQVIDNTLDVLKTAVNEGRLLPYTMRTNSGRGMGLYFVLNRSIANTKNTENMQKLYDVVYEKLYEAINKELKAANQQGIETLVLDTCVVGDHARLCRLPGTMNTKTGTFCTLEEVDETAMYELSDFCAILDMKKKKQTKKEKKHIVTNQETRFAVPYHAEFLKNLECLQASKYDWSGHHELFCFVYYNIAKQCLPYTEAVEALYRFNDSFADYAITRNRIKSIIKTVDRNVAKDGSYRGYYVLGKDWIANKLDLTEEERKEFHVTSDGGWKMRDYLKHKETVEKRIEKHKLVINAIITSNSYKEVMDQTGLAMSSIKYIAKEYGCTMTNKLNSVDDIDWNETFEKIMERSSCKRDTKSSISVCLPILLASRSDFIDTYDESNVPNFVSVSINDSDLWDDGFVSVADDETPFDTTDIVPFIDSTPITINIETYAMSFLRFLTEYCSKGFRDVAIKLYEYVDSFFMDESISSCDKSFFASLISLIGDKYRHIAGVEYSLYELDTVFQLIQTHDTSSSSLRKLGFTLKQVLNYVPVSATYHYQFIPQSVSLVPSNKPMKQCVLDKTDCHLISVADLLDGPRGNHCRDVLIAASGACDKIITYQLAINNVYTMMYRMGVARLLHLFDVTDKYQTSDFHDDSIVFVFCNDLCKSLHCKDIQRLTSFHIKIGRHLSKAQKSAGVAYREHQSLLQFARDHACDNSLCHMYWNSRRYLKEVETDTILLNGVNISCDVLLHKYLYHLRLNELLSIDSTDLTIESFLTKVVSLINSRMDANVSWTITLI